MSWLLTVERDALGISSSLYGDGRLRLYPEVLEAAERASHLLSREIRKAKARVPVGLNPLPKWLSEATAVSSAQHLLGGTKRPADDLEEEEEDDGFDEHDDGESGVDSGNGDAQSMDDLVNIAALSELHEDSPVIAFRDDGSSPTTTPFLMRHVSHHRMVRSSTPILPGGDSIDASPADRGVADVEYDALELGTDDEMEMSP